MCRSRCSCSSARPTRSTSPTASTGWRSARSPSPRRRSPRSPTSSTHRVFADYLQLVRFDVGRGGADDLLRRAGRREPRLPVVQLLSRRTSSWATSARWRSAARSAPSRCSIKQELLLVDRRRRVRLEALSVIIQVASFKLTGKRVFKMAPLHHHFELIGWSEPKVIARFLIVGDHLRAVQPDDAEAAMTTTSLLRRGQARRRRRRRAQRHRGGASCSCGAARRSRSPTCATLIDDERAAAASRRRRWSSAATRAATFARRRSDRAQPGRAARSAGARRGARRPACR